MKKILIIDDEPEIVAVLAEFLSARNYGTVTALDGEEGARKVRFRDP